MSWLFLLLHIIRNMLFEYYLPLQNTDKLASYILAFFSYFYFNVETTFYTALPFTI